MALLQNITMISSYGPLRIGSYHGANERPQWGPQPWTGTNKVFSGMSRKSGVPDGYRPPYCWFLPMTSGGLAIFKTMVGTSEIENALLAGRRALGTSIHGTCGITLDISAIAELVASIQGTGDLVADISGIVYIVAEIDGTSTVVSDIVGTIAAGSMMEGSSIVSAAIIAPVSIGASLDGTSAIESAILAGRFYILATLSGAGEISSADPLGPASMSCLISIGSRPTATAIASAVWTARPDQFVDPETFGRALYLAKQLAAGRMRTVGSVLTLYGKDCETEIAVFDLLNADGQPAEFTDDVVERVPR